MGLPPVMTVLACLAMLSACVFVVYQQEEVPHLPVPPSLYMWPKTTHKIVRETYHRLTPQELRQARSVTEQSKLIVTGLAYNSELDLDYVIPCIEATMALFKDARVVVYENDSTDGTLAVLRAWSKVNHRVHVISETFGQGSAMEGRKAHRHVLLGQYRQKYLSAVLDEKYADFDYLLVVDFDMINGWLPEHVLSSFVTQPNVDAWDVVCANGMDPTYGMHDVLAYRGAQAPLSPQLPPNGMGDSWWGDVAPKLAQQLKVGVDEPWVPVWSCYGGMQVMRREALVATGCNYTVRAQQEAAVYWLNVCLREKRGDGRIWINPAMVMRYGVWSDRLPTTAKRIRKMRP